LIKLHLKEYRDVAEITFSCPALSVPEFSGSWRHLEITNISSWWLPRQLCDECDRKDSWTWLVNDHNVKKPASRVLLLRYHLCLILCRRDCSETATRGESSSVLFTECFCCICMLVLANYATSLKHSGASIKIFIRQHVTANDRQETECTKSTIKAKKQAPQNTHSRLQLTQTVVHDYQHSEVHLKTAFSCTVTFHRTQPFL